MTREHFFIHKNKRRFIRVTLSYLLLFINSKKYSLQHQWTGETSWKLLNRRNESSGSGDQSNSDIVSLKSDLDGDDVNVTYRIMNLLVNEFDIKDRWWSVSSPSRGGGEPQRKWIHRDHRGASSGRDKIWTAFEIGEESTLIKSISFSRLISISFC